MHHCRCICNRALRSPSGGDDREPAPAGTSGASRRAAAASSTPPSPCSGSRASRPPPSSRSASRADVANRTFFNHFPTRDDMVRALAERRLLGLEGCWSSACAGGATAPELLVALFDDVAGTSRRRPVLPGAGGRDARLSWWPPAGARLVRPSPTARSSASQGGRGARRGHRRHDPLTLADIVVGTLVAVLMSWVSRRRLRHPGRPARRRRSPSPTCSPPPDLENDTDGVPDQPQPPPDQGDRSTTCSTSWHDPTDWFGRLAHRACTPCPARSWRTCSARPWPPASTTTGSPSRPWARRPSGRAITELREFDDVVPLLFAHAAYKCTRPRCSTRSAST